MAWLAKVSAPEMEEKFIKGKQYQMVGESMQEEARAYFLGTKDKDGNVVIPGVIGDKDLLLTDRLEIKKIVVNRADVNKSKLLAEYGQEAFEKVLDYKEIIQYRIKEIHV
jgi:hypothetical protein